MEKIVFRDALDGCSSTFCIEDIIIVGVFALHGTGMRQVRPLFGGAHVETVSKPFTYVLFHDIMVFN